MAAGKDRRRSPERATERVAVLMTPTEKAAYTARNAEAETRSLAEVEALEAALRQLERSTSRTEQSLDAALEEMAGLMKEQQRRLNDLQGRVIRLETVLEQALHRSSGASGRLLEADGDPTDARQAGPASP